MSFAARALPDATSFLSRAFFLQTPDQELFARVFFLGTEPFVV